MQVPRSKQEQVVEAAAAGDAAPGRGRKGPTKQQPNRSGAAAAAAAAHGRALLFCGAFGYGNITALVNDPSVDPLADGICYVSVSCV